MEELLDYAHAIAWRPSPSLRVEALPPTLGSDVIMVRSSPRVACST